MELGLDTEDIEAIKTGVVDWSLVELVDGAPDLLLEHREDGQRHVARLTAEQARKLLDVFEFERRQSKAPRPQSFPEPNLEGWTGVSPDSDWQSFVKSYRDAVELLGAHLKRDATAYLFLCRHTLELQLKAIIMLGQDAMSLSLDLPGHHDLDKLWTAAAPILAWATEGGLSSLERVRTTIGDFHRQDGSSISFRYPVNKQNKQITRNPEIQTFQGLEYATRMQATFDALDEGITRLRLRLMFNLIVEASPSKSSPSEIL